MTNKIDLYLDRFEGDYAVLIGAAAEFNFPRSLLPEDIREGDFVTFLMEVNKEKTGRSAGEIGRLRQELDSES